MPRQPVGASRVLQPTEVSSFVLRGRHFEVGSQKPISSARISSAKAIHYSANTLQRWGRRFVRCHFRRPGDGLEVWSSALAPDSCGVPACSSILRASRRKFCWRITSTTTSAPLGIFSVYVTPLETSMPDRCDSSSCRYASRVVDAPPAVPAPPPWGFPTAARPSPLRARLPDAPTPDAWGRAALGNPPLKRSSENTESIRVADLISLRMRSRSRVACRSSLFS